MQVNRLKMSGVRPRDFAMQSLLYYAWLANFCFTNLADAHTLRTGGKP